jgi:glycosyltransferase involved in cell wall biosynthesis
MSLARPVAIDARRLQEQPLGGVGRWLANLLPHLVKEADIMLLTDGRRPPVEGSVPQSALWLPAGLPEVVWVQVSAAWWLRSFTGVFHGTFNALPVAWRGPAVVSVHDLASVHHPEDFDQAPLKRRLWTAQLRQSVAQAKVIHTGSAFIRDEILATYGVDPHRVVVEPHAVDPVFSPDRYQHGRELAARLGVESPYVIAMGGAPRRGLPVAIAAWEQARRAGAEHALIVIGPEVPPPQPGLVHAGRLPDDEWADLLAGATALCYPTRYEGFGMPALEAAASGVPVVCARVSSLPEVLGDAAQWCDQPTVSDMAAALIRLLSDEDRRIALRAAGLAQAARSSTWEQSARVVLDAYEMAAA